MLTKSMVQKITASVGLKNIKIRLDNKLLRVLEMWPVGLNIHPAYDEEFRLREVILSVRDTLKSQKKTTKVLLLCPDKKTWVQMNLKIKKIKTRDFYVKIQLHKYH